MQNGRAFPGKAYGQNGIRLMRPGNLAQSGYLSWEPSKTVCLSQEWEREAEDFVVGPGDVVMNLTAQSLEDGFMGRVCLARAHDRCLLNQRIGRFVAWKTGVLPEYVFRVFQTSRFRAHAIEMCEGSKVKHIFWPYVARYVFRCPSLDEQSASVDVLREVDAQMQALVGRCQLHRSLHRHLIAESLMDSDSSTPSEP
jgi:type I restriction enzyme, S subunit